MICPLCHGKGERPVPAFTRQCMVMQLCSECHGWGITSCCEVFDEPAEEEPGDGR